MKGLAKSFDGLQAVRDVTLKIMPGDRKAIIGPNGAGKTTLFNVITGIFPATSGQVLLFGQDVTSWPSHRRIALGMARTFQITSLFPMLTVLDNVLLAIEGRGRSKFVMWRFHVLLPRRVRQGPPALLEQAGFLDRKDVEVRNLSHGEQRQLEIVLGLASDPKILLLDEPAAGLSSGESAEMAQVPDAARPQPRDPADRARHGRGVRRRRRKSRFCTSAKFWKPARPSRSATATRSRKSIWGPIELMAILEVQDIHTYYGDAYVLQGLSLQLEQGQILGLLGRNGVGKTTLVNSIVGFNPPRRGKIVFKGDDITGIPRSRPCAAAWAWCRRAAACFRRSSVEENLLVAERNPDRHGWNLERVYELFPRLQERRNQRAKTLSGGEQQMLAIGRGLMTNPDCLIMDEPSEGLAPIIIQGVWEAIGKLKEEGLSILLVEQNAASRAQARRLRARDEQGPGGLFGQPGRAAGQRRDQVELSGNMNRRIEAYRIGFLTHLIFDRDDPA